MGYEEEINLEICGMQRIAVITHDGSHTISIPAMKVTYHSMHGAVTESQHVYINAGFYYVVKSGVQTHELAVLEVGFGTGLNALLTMAAADELPINVYYTALEPFPLTTEEVRQLNYESFLQNKKIYNDFLRIHACGWNQPFSVSEKFMLQKVNSRFQEFDHTTGFNLVYFDAFAPEAQPELWTKEVFEKLYMMMQLGGVLVTYSSKGEVRKTMLSVGFYVEKLPGPPGKREMIRALKSH